MDTEIRELIDALTTELERCEGAIAWLYAQLSDAGLADESVADAVHKRKQAILKLVL